MPLRDAEEKHLARAGRQTDGLYLEATLQPHEKPRTLLFRSPAWAAVPENLHRLIELLNLQWLFQDRDRADLKNPIENLAIRITCDHDNVEVHQSAWLFYTPDHRERQAIASPKT